ncbi:MAG: PspC domain-containing protein [Pyrinomonadaceae bacterium]|nr:PspC domain-containing protein [Sphingobacteriaceae bacterium]
MNKTIIININGIVFHIEEDAYEVLKAYMTEVKRHFAYSVDSLEIVTDIENRLAEMFSELLTAQNKQVIELSDVEAITAQMGRPADFEISEDNQGMKNSDIKSQRSLYKDNDDKVIGGVCAGLAHYFNMEVKWVRLITVLATATTGIGIIPYIVLWIVLPTAITRADKMAMKGEAINLQNFQKSFDEEVQAIQTDDHRSQMHLRSMHKHNDPIKEILTFIGRVLKIIIKVVGIFIIAVGAMALFGLLIGLLFGLGFINHTEFQHFPLNAINSEFRSPVYFSAFLILFIPLIGLILFAIRVIINKKIVSGYGSFSMLILWLTGVFMGVYYGSKIAAEFQDEAKFEQVTELNSYPQLTLKLNPKLFFTKEDSLHYNIGSSKIRGRVLFDKDNLEEKIQNFDLFIDKSEDGKLSVVKELSAKGANFEQALQSAQRISYQVHQLDSLIQFDKYLALKGNELFRDQEIDVRL